MALQREKQHIIFNRWSRIILITWGYSTRACLLGVAARATLQPQSLATVFIIIIFVFPSLRPLHCINNYLYIYTRKGRGDGNTKIIIKIVASNCGCSILGQSQNGMGIQIQALYIAHAHWRLVQSENGSSIRTRHAYLFITYNAIGNVPLWARGPQRLGWGTELTHTATGEW